MWNRFTVPKHRIILWLTMLDRLKTKTRLHQLGIGEDNLYVVVVLLLKLFLTSSLIAPSAQSRKLIMTWLGFHSSRNYVYPLLNRVQRYTKGKFKKTVCFTAIASLV